MARGETAFVTNQHLWLWAPACAGATQAYCAALIAQVTLTVIDSVSSPGATGVGALPAIGAAILLRKTGGEAAPSSEMLSGSPSVTPAALA